jgi:hypothetical protein
MRTVLSAIFALNLLCGLTLGQSGTEPENWCRSGKFTAETENYRLASVKAVKGGRSYFYNDFTEDCPEAENCREKAYVVSGDQVVISNERKGFACAWFTPVKGTGYVGWLKAGDLNFWPINKDPGLAAWYGTWRYGENEIKFESTRVRGYLNVIGTAFWKGLGDNIHIGELSNRGKVVADRVEYSDGDDEYDCKATIRMVGQFLVVRDNMNCGGVNVSFSGVYRKVKR